MRFERVIRRVWCEPWLILPAMHKTIADVLENHIARTAVAFVPDGGDQPSMQIVDGVAVIPVKGVISKDISQMERISGAVDVGDIESMIAAAVADDKVSGIVLDVDSPGGTVTGVPELAAMIAEVNNTKPAIAFTSGLMASAAYWLSSGASQIYATESSEVGSIGVYVAYLDQSRRYDAAGVKVEMIKSESSPLKGAGYPGTSLSDAQRDQLQSSVDYLYERFSGFVRDHRRGVGADAMNGRTVFGLQAHALGLVDAVASKTQAIRDVNRLAANRK